jgi:3-deoxy-D-manno-octulosonic-acid transferase
VSPGEPERLLAPGVRALRDDPNPGPIRGLLHLVYDLAWIGAALLGFPWLLWKSRRTEGFGAMVRERLGEGLGALPAAERGRPRVLVHGVSVGEVKGALPIVRALEEAFEGIEVVISSTTDTGMAIARELFGDRRVVRFPIDLSFVLRRFLRRVRPSFVVLVELEIWPNFLRECNRSHLPVAVVNGRITDWSHSRYLFFRKLMPQFNRISLFCVQSELYAERFGALGVERDRILVTGNIKADGLRIGAVAPGEELVRLLGPRDGQLVLVAGSTHGPEEGLVVGAWQEGVPEARLILVPRHPRRVPEVVRELEEAGWAPRRLSRLRSGEETPDPSQPVLVDTIGELERVYGLADLVFVGGTLVDHGGQNMLEPAAQGRPILLGPSVTNFLHESRLLLDAGAIRQVADAEELAASLRELAADPLCREEMSRAGLEAVARQRGAARKTLQALSELSLASLTGVPLESPRSQAILQGTEKG